MPVNKTPDFEAMVTKLRNDVVRYTARAGVNFFMDSFEKQGFTDTIYEPWEKRKNDIDPGRNILVKSASLFNSIEVFSKSKQRIVFGSQEAHAQIHNEGGTIRVRITPKARKYFWYMWHKTGGGMWKGLALTSKEELTIHIPKRQFMGHSETLMEEVSQWLIQQLNTRFTRL